MVVGDHATIANNYSANSSPAQRFDTIVWYVVAGKGRNVAINNKSTIVRQLPRALLQLACFAMMRQASLIVL